MTLRRYERGVVCVRTSLLVLSVVGAEFWVSSLGAFPRVCAHSCGQKETALPNSRSCYECAYL